NNRRQHTHERDRVFARLRGRDAYRIAVDAYEQPPGARVDAGGHEQSEVRLLVHLEVEQFDPGGTGQLGEMMVVDEIERRVEQRTARIRLHRLQRVTSITVARTLQSGNVFDGLQACRRCDVQPDRNRVKEQSGGHFGPGT